MVVSRCVIVTTVVGVLAGPASTPLDAQPAPERWTGKVEIPSQPLEFAVTFNPAEDGSAIATIDIPAQGAVGLALADVIYTESDIAFTLAQAPPSGAVFTATRDGDTAAGQLQQAGQTMPLSMTRVEGDVAVGPRRPQTPAPPFPYASHDVDYTNTVDGTMLAGTFTVPDGPGPHPAVILITGSGAQDRDETILGHKPFLVLADHLTRRGIAVLRVDDRGVGGSSGSIATSTSQDLAGDVRAGLAFLKDHPDVDDTRLGLIGHSEGGLIAPIVAAGEPDVAFVVMLAGTGFPGREILQLQLRLIQEGMGRSPDNVDRQVEAQRHLIARLEADAPAQEIQDAVLALLRIQLSGVDAAAVGDGKTLAATQAASMATPWFRSFLRTDPREALRRVACPVLALNGSLDLQVPADANLPAIEQALRAGGNTDVTTTTLDGLNHLFQTATTGLPTEYAAIEETFAPHALDLVSDWIRDRAGL